MPGYSRQPMETKHTLISLNITDDYFKAKKQAEIFEQDLQQKDQEMYELKHELDCSSYEDRRDRKQGTGNPAAERASGRQSKRAGRGN